MRECAINHTLTFALAKRMRKIYNTLEILIVLYILNAVYPDNGDYQWPL